MKINILDEASAELDDAFQYYEYEQENLGYRFISKFTPKTKLLGRANKKIKSSAAFTPLSSQRRGWFLCTLSL